MSENPCKKRAVGYGRVSTSSESQKSSLPNQKERIQSYCKSREWNLVRFFKDRGASGKNLKREGFRKLESFIEKDQIQTLIVTNLDRFSRDPKDVIEQMDWLKDIGVHFVSIDQAIDTSTTAGEMVMVLISYLNRMEREKTAAKIQASLDRKKEKGEPLGRPPYGLKYSQDKSCFVPGEKFTQALRGIELREEGVSLTRIEQEVGISTSTLSRLMKRKGFYRKLACSSRTPRN